MAYTDAISEQVIQQQLNVQFVDDAERDYVLEQLLPAAWESCAAFCNRQVFATSEDMEAVPEDERGCYPLVARAAFRQAVLLTLGHFWRNREALADDKLVEMPLGSRSLLWPLRASLGV